MTTDLNATNGCCAAPTENDRDAPTTPTAGPGCSPSTRTDTVVTAFDQFLAVLLVLVAPPPTADPLNARTTHYVWNMAIQWGVTTTLVAAWWWVGRSVRDLASRSIAWFGGQQRPASHRAEGESVTYVPADSRSLCRRCVSPLGGIAVREPREDRYAREPPLFAKAPARQVALLGARTVRVTNRESVLWSRWSSRACGQPSPGGNRRSDAFAESATTIGRWRPPRYLEP
jgi:hypothetical protein